MAILSVNHLAKSFGSQTLFEDLNLLVNGRERVAIIGGNTAWGGDTAGLPLKLFSTDSRFFLVEGEIRFGRLTRSLAWVIERNGRASTIRWSRES